MANYKSTFKSIQGEVRNEKPISIVICARNEANNLEKNLPRILNQNYRSFEVIVVNDNSNDTTYDVLLKYKKIFSLEEHNQTGGIGSILSDLIVEKNLDVRLKKLALKEKNHFYDKIHTEESKKKMSKSLSGKIYSISFIPSFNLDASIRIASFNGVLSE